MKEITLKELMDIVENIEMYNSEYQFIEDKVKELLSAKREDGLEIDYSKIDVIFGNVKQARSLKIFNDLIETIVNNSENNEAKITNVELWAKSWKEEMKQALTLTDVSKKNKK